MKTLHDHVYKNKNKKTNAWILEKKKKKWSGVGSEFPDSDIPFSGCCRPEVFLVKVLLILASVPNFCKYYNGMLLSRCYSFMKLIFYKQFKYSPTQTPFPTLCTGMRCYNDSWNHCTMSLCKHKEQGLICNPGLLQFTSFVKIGLLTIPQQAHSSVLTSPRLL